MTILSKKGILVLITTGTILNLSLRAISGYINPRDFVQDIVAARQVLHKQTLYPQDMPSRARAELYQEFWGVSILKRLPGIKDEFQHLDDPTAQLNAHPPAAAVVMAPLLACLQMRECYIILYCLLLILTLVNMRIISNSLLKRLPRSMVFGVAALYFGSISVVDSLRAPSPTQFVPFFLIAAWWVQTRRHSDVAAGFLVGFATLLQVTPALVLVYYAWRKRRAFFSGCMTIGAGVALCSVVVGYGSFIEWFRTAQRVTALFVGLRANVSVHGALYGVIKDVVPTPALHIAVAAVVCTTVLGLVYWLHVRGRSTTGMIDDVEYCVVVVLMLLVSPVTWSRNLTVMILPVAVMIGYNIACASKVNSVLSLLCIVLLVMPTQVSEMLYPVAIKTFGSWLGWISSSLTTCGLLGVLWLLSGARRVVGFSSGPEGRVGGLSSDGPIVSCGSCGE